MQVDLTKKVAREGGYIMLVVAFLGYLSSRPHWHFLVPFVLKMEIYTAAVVFWSPAIAWVSYLYRKGRIARSRR
jgi:hypothetical protein